jgi:hypothetical protein
LQAAKAMASIRQEMAADLRSWTAAADNNRKQAELAITSKLEAQLAGLDIGMAELEARFEAVRALLCLGLVGWWLVFWSRGAPTSTLWPHISNRQT